MSAPVPLSTFEAQSAVHIPRVAIKFCTQCKWNLRAAYYAQELLQTFSTSLGEVSLQPVTGGIFTVTLFHPITSAPVAVHNDPVQQSGGIAPPAIRARAPSISIATAIRETLIWDRKRDGGFPETKELKNRVRNIIEPDRDLGHIDRSLKKIEGNSGAGNEHGGETPKTEADVVQKMKEQADAVGADQSAAGGESLQFGENVEKVLLPNPGAKKDAPNSCEDCK